MISFYMHISVKLMLTVITPKQLCLKIMWTPTYCMTKTQSRISYRVLSAIIRRRWTTFIIHRYTYSGIPTILFDWFGTGFVFGLTLFVSKLWNTYRYITMNETGNCELPLHCQPQLSHVFVIYAGPPRGRVRRVKNSGPHLDWWKNIF